MDKLIAVAADTLEEAVEKAADLFDCALDEVAYQEQEGHSEERTLIWAESLAHQGGGALHLPGSLPIEPGAVEPPRRVGGDISPTSGHIVHSGDILVTGRVRTGARIQARGNIRIYGDVESSATIIAGEDIMIRGGLLGTAKSIRGDVTFRYAYGAAVTAGTIRVLEDAVQCSFTAHEEVDVGRSLRGGSAYAERIVQAAVIGDPKGATASRIKVGENRRLLRVAAVAQNRLDAAESDALASFYTVNVARLLTRLKERTEARIKAHDTIYPGCQVTVGKNRLDIERELCHATFWNDPETGMLRVSHDE